MLEHLVAVYDVVRLIGDTLQVADIPVRKSDVGDPPFGGVLPRLVEHVRAVVDSGDVTQWNEARQRRRDRSGPTPDIKNVHRRLEVFEQVGCRVLGCPPGMGAEHGFVVAMGVCRVLWHDGMKSHNDEVTVV